MRAELACDPICAVDSKTGTVKVVFSFAMIDADGELVELSWEASQPQENGKRHGGTARCLAESLPAPIPLEISIPLALFSEPTPVELQLRSMKPLRSLGHGRGIAEADPEHPSGAVNFRLRSWRDLT